jgi:hypothetical protein
VILGAKFSDLQWDCKQSFSKNSGRSRINNLALPRTSKSFRATADTSRRSDFPVLLAGGVVFAVTARSAYGLRRR